ncbi:hypothetical protein CPC08DRAFT_755807 [Agrocybe pediades]|nr:hypothetical protein CPC08DRAFT_755807 [Agrocybe pediades]
MLTRLKINNVTASSVPTTTAFWNALRNMGALQILHLSGTLPIVDDASRSNSKVHLPNLLCIHLRGEPDQIARFLNGVVLPTEVLLDLLCEAADSISCVDALRALSATIQLEVGTLTISQPVKNGYQIRANFTHQTAQKTKQFAWKHSEYGSFESNLSLRVTIQHPNIELPPLDNLWTTLFHELPFFKVSKATLDLEAPIPPAILAATLGALPKLETMYVDVRLSTVIVHALQQDPPAFPSLSDLTLYENDFRSIYSWNGSTCTHEELLECMTKRRKCELPIRQLTLSGNRFWFRRTKNKTAALREVVDKVEYGLNSLSIIYDVDYSRYEESEPEA